MPRVCREVARHPAPGVQAPGRGRRLGRSLRHHEAQGRGRHLPRVREVPLLGRALSRQEVGDVVGGREDGPRRSRGRVSRPYQPHDLCPLSPDQSTSAGAGGGQCRHLDHDTLDHPGQPRRRLWRGRGLPAGPRRRRGRRQLGEGWRAPDPGRPARPGGGGRGRDHPLHRGRGLQGGGACGCGGVAPLARPCRRLRLRRPAAGRRLRHHRPGHRPRPHRPQPWRGRLRAGCEARARGAGHGGRGRQLYRGRAGLRRAQGVRRPALARQRAGDGGARRA